MKTLLHFSLVIGLYIVCVILSDVVRIFSNFIYLTGQWLIATRRVSLSKPIQFIFDPEFGWSNLLNFTGLLSDAINLPNGGLTSTIVLLILIHVFNLMVSRIKLLFDNDQCIYFYVPKTDYYSYIHYFEVNNEKSVILLLFNKNDLYDSNK